MEYLHWLGVDTIWLSPVFVSPFRDAGYNISDYQRIAPRYGTDEDLADLVESARRHGIRILLDPVAGHTSDVHPWFRQALDNPGDDRYIWADRPAPGFVASPGLDLDTSCAISSTASPPSTDVLPRCLVG
ncbi:alpha-amylase family glycosyl hydrolase [Micromonospora aurantiaca]|uniref:alpha-amylase family glycosyl hydrolase n=1 Tax=Micromonospora aurantiaca (nom. illeg.) TaxID=47850 RepID=UPI0039C9B438|nr:hypothetical protein LF814_08970 [Micromonospora aurantiaca]